MPVRYFVSRFVLISAAMLLSACSYFDTGENIEVSNQGSQRVDLMTGEASGSVGSGDATYQDAVRNQSNGSVEIYSLDAPLPDTVPTYVPSRQPTVQPSMQNYMNEIEAQPLEPAEPYDLRGEVESYSLGDEDMAVMTTGEDSALPSIEEDMAVVSSPDADGLYTVYFDFGSAKLDAQDLEIVNEVARGFNPSAGVGLDVRVGGFHRGRGRPALPRQDS